MDLHAEYQRGLLFVEAGDPIEGSKILRTVVDAEPDNTEARLQLALAYFASAQLNKAETEFRTLVERDPSDHYAHHLLGRTLERLNRPGDALGYLRLAAAMSPSEDYRKAVDRVSGRSN